MKRRSFFRALARAAGIIALAPQLAFRPKWGPVIQPFWTQTKRMSRTVDDAYLKKMAELESRAFTFQPSWQDFVMKQP